MSDAALRLIALLALCGISCINAVGPQLIGFTWDAGFAQTILTFDQPVQSATFDFTKVRLQGMADLNGTEGYGMEMPLPFNDPTTDGNTTDIRLTMYNEDSARFKYSGIPWGKTADDLFVALDGSAVRDIDGAYNEVVTTSAAFQVTEMIPDSVSPEPKRFDLDMATGILSINFTEPVNISSFTLVGLAFQSRLNYDVSDTKRMYLVDTGTTGTSFHHRCRCRRRRRRRRRSYKYCLIPHTPLLTPPLTPPRPPTDAHSAADDKL